MADLDDFFAKKDKKKAKSKPKFLTAEELVKNLEDTSKREAAARPKKPELNTATDNVVAPSEGIGAEENQISSIEEKPPQQQQEPEPTEEEWKEFEEEQRKDYSGLKIGQLAVNDDDDQSQTEGDEDDEYESNTMPDMRRSTDGPWKKVIPAEEVTQIPMEVAKSTQVYISPALRNSGLGTSRTLKSRNRAAPDITNADYFPTLGAARPEEQRKKKNEPAFEEPPQQQQEPEPTEEEWKEFEEEQRKDYSGLKIGQLAVNDDDDQSQTEGDEDDEYESNTMPDMRRSTDGPWKKVIPAEEVTQIPMEVAKSTQVYISPALRNSGLGTSRTLKSRNRAAPDITNADYFPTLGAARPEEQRKKKNEPAFEEVRHGGRVQRIKEQQPAAPATVANRFQSLEEDDS